MSTAPFKKIYTTNEVRATADALGSYFFSDSTMSFFKSRLSSKIKTTGDLSGYFITSEKYDTNPRHYSVRYYKVEQYIRESDGRVCDSIDIGSVDDLPDFSTMAQAVKAMNQLS